MRSSRHDAGNWFKRKPYVVGRYFTR
jgi:hypothetical protein